MRTITHVYDEVKYTEKVNVVCHQCKKAMKVSVSGSATVNPFNKNEDGSIKNRQEVAEQARQSLKKAVLGAPEHKHTCRQCEFDKNAPKPESVEYNEESISLTIDDVFINGCDKDDSVALQVLTVLNKKVSAIQDHLRRKQSLRMVGKEFKTRKGQKVIILRVQSPDHFTNQYYYLCRKPKGIETFYVFHSDLQEASHE
jgi:hypothetical protein